MTRSKKFTLRDPILTVFNGIEDYTLRIGGLSEKIAKDEFRMTVAIRDTMAKASKVDGGALMSELAVENGKVSAPMNGGKAIGEAMVNKLRAIGEAFDSESIDQLNGCASVKSLRSIASAKKLSRTLKNEIVVAIGKAGGVYSDKDLIELAKFAKTKEAAALSASEIVERMPAGCAKGGGAGGAETGMARIKRLLEEEYESRKGEPAKNANTLADWFQNVVLPQSQSWIEENGEEL